MEAAQSEYNAVWAQQRRRASKYVSKYLMNTIVSPSLSLSFSLWAATALHEWSCWQMILLQVLEIINKQVIIDTFKPHVANVGRGDKVSEEYNMKPL